MIRVVTILSLLAINQGFISDVLSVRNGIPDPAAIAANVVNKQPAISHPNVITAALPTANVVTPSPVPAASPTPAASPVPASPSVPEVAPIVPGPVPAKTVSAVATATATTAKPAPAKKYIKVAEKKSTCSDVRDTKCKDIDNFENCGFCIVGTYSVEGYGVPYTKEVKMVKDQEAAAVGKKKYITEVQISPSKDCNGTFILEGKNCPSCDTALACLYECAKVEAGKADVIEIPAKCVAKEACNTPIDFLTECGFVKAEEEEKTVVMKMPKANDPKTEATPVVVVMPKEDPKEKAVVTKAPKADKPKIVTATASASANVSSK